MFREVEKNLLKRKEHAKELLLTMTIMTITAENFEERNQKEKVEELRTMLIDLIKMQKEVEYNVAILEEFKKMTPEELAKADVDSLFSTKLSRMKAKEPKNFYKNHDKLKSFDLKVWNVHHRGEPLPGGDDDEIMVYTQESNATLKCPLTQDILEDPYKSKVCSHVFSKRAIENHLRRGPKHCPVAGCGKTIQLNDLEEDLETAYMVKRLKNQVRKETSQNPTIDMEDDD